MSKMDQILETCLQAIDRGDAIETVLFRYPEIADELRPILEAAVSAKNKAMFTVPPEIVRRNRAKLLQHAAEMRESRRKRRPLAIWSVPLRRIVVTLTVLAVVFASGTGLVRAASMTLPGDNLYPVKRTWEDVLVLVTFNSQKREFLELEHENERLEEVQELFEEGRSAPVDFSGLITAQSAASWMVAGINVLISPQTNLPQASISVGTEVRVVGHAQDGIVQAGRIELLSLNEVNSAPVASSTGSPEMNQTPAPSAVNDSNSNQQPEATESNSNQQPEATESNSNQEPEVTESNSTQEPEATEVDQVETEKPFEPQSKSFKGVVQSVSGSTWIISGVTVDVRKAEISGVQAVGVVAKVEGYINQNGIFIAERIELPENESGNDSVGSSSGDVNSNPTPEEQHEDEHEEDHATETPEPQH